VHLLIATNAAEMFEIADAILVQNDATHGQSGR
jgi:hypothetical protein